MSVYRMCEATRGSAHLHKLAKIVLFRDPAEVLVDFPSRRVKRRPLRVLAERILIGMGWHIARDACISILVPSSKLNHRARPSTDLQTPPTSVALS